MRKIFTLFAAMLLAITASATTPSTNFESPYKFTATDASIEGAIVKTSHVVDPETTNEYLRYYDNATCGTAEWEITCTAACFVSVTLNMYDNSWNYKADDDERKLFKNGGHKFQVKIIDGSTVLDSIAEPTESDAYNNIALSGEMYVPAGTHKIKLLNNRAWSKCGISGVTFTKVAIPSTNFADGYDFTAAAAAISGNSVKCYHYTNPYIRYNDNATPGIATWRIYASRPCFVNVSMYMVDNTWNTDSAGYYKNSGHRFIVELLNVENQPIDSVREESESTKPGTFPGSFNMPSYLIIPSAGYYTIRLLNRRAHSKCGLEKVTLTYSSDIPTVTAKGAWDGWASPVEFDLAADGQSASGSVHLDKSDNDYLFKMIIGSDWRSWNDFQFRRGETESTAPIDDNHAEMKIKADLTGNYILTWGFKDRSLRVTFPKPQLENGWYLVGTFNSVDAWDVEDLTAAKKFVPNPAETEKTELMITVPLKLGDVFKAAYVYLDEFTEHKPNGTGNDYTVDADHAGDSKTIYLRPNGDGDGTWWHNVLFVPANEPTSIDNTVVGEKAVKFFENGQLFIQKDGKTYNILGTIVK